ncbi:MAG TPA: hypothetical protein VJ768_02840, partial [Anaerolineales bacterium]|nr:hypothetical protein [Anaerolineales bacterium]
QGRGETEAALGLLTREGNRGVLLPLDELRPERLETYTGSDGYLGIAADLVAYRPEARAAVDLILGRTLVVDDLAAARRVLENQSADIRAVTLAGEVLTNEGPIFAAGNREETTFSRPRRRRQIAAEIDALKGSVREAESRLASLNERIGGLEESREEASQLLSRADEAVKNSLEKTKNDEVQAETLSHQASWQKSQLEILGIEEAEALHELGAYNREEEALSMEGMGIEDQLRELRGSLAGLPLDETRNNLNHWELQAAISRQVLDGARARIEERAAAIERSKAEEHEFRNRLDRQAADLAGLEADIARNREEELEVSAAIEAHNQVAGPVESDLRGLESLLDKNREDEARVRQQLTLAERYHTQAQIAFARQQEAMETLRRRIEDDFGLVAYAYEDEVTGPNPLPLEGMVEELPVVLELSPDLENSLNRRRLRLRRMGAVNPEAPAEYREVSERHRFLTEQLADLESAEGHIKDVIAELDTLMERDFRKTFDAVAAEFRANFGRLFGGGSARLTLTDPEDLTNSGIDIDAQLPGRRTQGLSLLSGGERSLVASALIFALIQVSPTPFCVLDEVDAMLDEANVGRFREMLQELSESTQFILITHNRGTVEAADVIYGITMGRDSTSQMLSLKLDQIPELVA